MRVQEGSGAGSRQGSKVPDGFGGSRQGSRRDVPERIENDLVADGDRVPGRFPW